MQAAELTSRVCLPVKGLKPFWLLILLAVGVQPGFAQRAPDRPETVFSEAYALYSDAIYEHAIEQFEAFRQAWPDHANAPEALYYQAEASLASGRQEEAKALFLRFREQYRAHPLALRASLALGQHFFLVGAYAEALRELTVALSPNLPDDINAEALYWMGASASHLGQIEDAVEYYGRAGQDYPYTRVAPRALYALGRLHYEHGELDDAANAFRSLSADYANSESSRQVGLVLAEIYYALGQYDQAASEALRRMSSLPASREGRVRLLVADAYNRMRDFESAIPHYRRILDQDPESPYYREALYGLAWAYHNTNAYVWAAEHFERAFEGHSDSLAMRAAYHAAANHTLGGQHGRATELFLTVAERWPQAELAAHALYEKGMVEFAERRWQDAHDSFSRLLEEHPSSPRAGDAVRQRGYAGVALNDFDRAFGDFERAVELGAAAPALRGEVLFQEAWLRFRAGDFNAAATAFLGLYEKHPTAEKAGDALFWAAESYYQVGDLDSGQSLLKQYQRAFPGGDHAAAAHYALGWIHFRREQYEGAIREFGAYLRVAPANSPYRRDARLRLADSHYAAKRFAEAIRHYGSAAAAHDDYALYQVGRAHHNLGNTTESARAFQTLIDSAPGSDYQEEAQYALAYVYFQTQDYTRAIKEYETFLRQYPEDPLAAKAQYGIGDAYFNSGQLTEAVQAYTDVLANYPTGPVATDAATSIQYALAGTSDTEQASRIIGTFVRAHPESPVAIELQFRQAEAKYQSGNSSEALEDFRRFVEQHTGAPQAPDAHYYLGVIYQALGRSADAESSLRLVLAQPPGTLRRVDAASMLGRVLLHQGRNEEARDLYRMLQQFARGDVLLEARAKYGQAQALLGLGHLSEAENILRHATDDPRHAPILLGRGRLFEEQGRVSEAIDLYRNVVRQNGEDIGAEALYYLGRALLSDDEPRAAIEELSRMPQLFGAYPEHVAGAYLVQAHAYRRLERPGEAQRLYDLVITEYSDSSHAEEALRGKATL